MSVFRVRSLRAVIVFPLLLGGCVNSLVSDDHIRSQTALRLNVPTEAVSISDRRYDGNNATYYEAHVYGRSYDCVLTGGTALELGMTSGVGCEQSHAEAAR